MLLYEKKYSQLEKDFVLFLTHTKGIGRKTIFNFLKFLIKHEKEKLDFWVIISFFFSKNTKYKKLYTKVKKINFEQNIDKIKKNLEENNIRVVYFFEAEYPKLLRTTDDYPLLLFYKGDLNALHTVTLAVIGTRKMTYYGKKVIDELVPDLISYGVTTVSGAMYGVDIQAHKKSIESQGRTIAVLGYGFCNVPGYAQRILEKIVSTGGCVLTEYAPNSTATKGTFPERNRIVAGLSLGVVVIEAAQKSGTLITVNCALEAGREVFAVPGSIFSPYSEGTKELLQKGAILVSSAHDIFTELPSSIIMPEFNDNVQGRVQGTESFFESEILAELLHAPRLTTELATRFEIEIPELLVHLSMLELKNKIVKDADYWQLVIS